MELRLATVADAPAIMAIYNREVLGSATTFDLVPRTLAEQEDYIRSRSGALALVVAEDDDGLAGFASLSFYRDRPGYRTSVEDSIYVDRRRHGQGVGSLLLGALIEEAKGRGFHSMFARVLNGAEPSVSLHQKHGFELVGTEREVGRKFGRWHDVALLQLLL